METATSFASAALLLLLIIDPFGNLVTINSILREVPPGRRQRVILRECIIAFFILVGFLLVGERLLGLLGLRPPTLSISGGIVLFLIALRMVFPTKDRSLDRIDGEPMVVPIAVPLIAGPSTLAMILLLATREPGAMLKWFGAVCAALGLSTLLLWASPLFFDRLGHRVTMAAERLVGMLLIMLAVQMFLDGLETYLAGR